MKPSSLVLPALAVAGRLFTTTVLASSAFTVGCAGREITVRTDSSADAASYAATFPERLAANREILQADTAKAAELTQGLAGRDKDLPNEAEPVLLLEIVGTADSAGRSQAFVDANREARTVRTFWDEERGPITSRANGAAQKQATEAGCQNVDLGPSLSYAVRDGIDKQLEKRLRENNEATRVIELNKAALGPANVPRVQKLADDIAYASYLVNVALVEDKDELNRLARERGSVASTIKRALEDEKNFRETGAKTPSEKRISDERIARLEKSQAALEPEGLKAEEATRDLNLTIEQARKDYEAALDALEDALRARRDRSERPR